MENYQHISVIGKGNFGSISKIRRITDGKTLVWKEIDYGKMSDKEKSQIVSEVNILRELNHPNIVKYYDRIIDKQNSKIYIIMEYCEGGDISHLIKRLKKNKESLTEDLIWKMFTQLILALFECHNLNKDGKKVLHRDLKPNNVFIDCENNIKLGDFGLARILNNTSIFAQSHVGTPYYMSPEQIEEKEYDDKSDIWSLGCFLYEITTLNPPFEAKNHYSLALKIKSGKVEKINSRYSDELQRVILWLLQVDQNRRPSIEDLLNLPQVNLRIREKRLKDNFFKLKKFEENLKRKENEIVEKEDNLKKREESLIEKEKEIEGKEALLSALIKKNQNQNPLLESNTIQQSIRNSYKNSNGYSNCSHKLTETASVKGYDYNNYINSSKSVIFENNKSFDSSKSIKLNQQSPAFNYRIAPNVDQFISHSKYNSNSNEENNEEKDDKYEMKYYQRCNTNTQNYNLNEDKIKREVKLESITPQKNESQKDFRSFKKELFIETQSKDLSIVNSTVNSNLNLKKEVSNRKLITKQSQSNQNISQSTNYSSNLRTIGGNKTSSKTMRQVKITDQQSNIKKNNKSLTPTNKKVIFNKEKEKTQEKQVQQVQCSNRYSIKKENLSPISPKSKVVPSKEVGNNSNFEVNKSLCLNNRNETVSQCYSSLDYFNFNNKVTSNSQCFNPYEIQSGNALSNLNNYNLIRERLNTRSYIN